MAELQERIKHLFGHSIEAKITASDAIAEHIESGAQRLVNCLLSDGKIFLCGNGASAANGFHFTTAMLNRFEVERPSLPVIMLATDLSMLTSIGNDGHYDQIFSRQIQALGCDNDVLLVISTSGNSDNLLQAVTAAKERGMDILALNGRDGGLLANHLGPEDIEVRVANDNAARISEVHLLILHCFCDLIDQSLFGQIMG